MECITVLKNPETREAKFPPTNDILAEQHISGKSRFCSHKNIGLIHGTILLFFTVSFVSHLYLHAQLLAKDQEITKLNAKLNDLLLAHEIDQINSESSIKQENGMRTEFLSKKESTRNRRENQCHVPHFFLDGHTQQHHTHDHISQQGVFFWKHKHINGDDFSAIKDHSGGTDYLDGLQIHKQGTYHLFVQVHVNGRTDAQRTNDPAVGIYLKRNGNGRSTNNRTLTKAFITQENKGHHFIGHPSRSYPVDVLKLDGLFFLGRGDTIYVTRPEDQENNYNIRYNNREGFAHFGGYMVEPSGSC